MREELAVLLWLQASVSGLPESTFLPASLEGQNIAYWWGTMHDQAVQSKDKGLTFCLFEKGSHHIDQAGLKLWSAGISDIKAREDLILKYVSKLNQHTSIWECGYIPREDGYSGSFFRVDYPSRPNYSRPWSSEYTVGFLIST